jgi:hypothetical protein
MGAHPDWPEVIQPLHSGLPESGWTTLSVQMPILANDARAAGNESYRQLAVEDADHFYIGPEDELLPHVLDWLQHQYDQPGES